ncbi:MAG: GNAT family N-acetyltransferase [Thermomicrobiales bacterium]
MVTDVGSILRAARIHEQVRVLSPDDLHAIRLGNWSRLNPDEMRRMLTDHPGRSVWLPETQEFAVVAPWRRRQEIANILELAAVKNPEALVQGAVERSRASGDAVILCVEIDERRRPEFYDRVGFHLAEEVITYELQRREEPAAPVKRVAFRRADPRLAEDLDVLRTIDERAFPWLWRNSTLEFVEYGADAGVELFVGYWRDAPVSYIGVTSYLGWGHLDRVAVLPDQQGQGIGLESVRFAVQRIEQSGAKRIGLSTQRLNERSQRLYERIGFRRSISNDYRVYARLLNMPEDVVSIT